MVLPHLASLRRQGDHATSAWRRISGIEDHDWYMTIHCLLVLWTASSINSDDVRWMENAELVGLFREMENMSPYDGGLERGWTAQCKKVMALMTQIVVDLMCSEEETMFAEMFWHPVEQGSRGENRVAGLIDRLGVGLLRDVFFVVTGVQTVMDMEANGFPAEKSSRTEEIPTEGDEDVGWVESCVDGSTSECELGMCGHMKGVVPKIRCR